MAQTITSCQKTSWKGRLGYRLANDVVESTVLTGGGSIADWRFRPGSDKPSENVLWESPWPTMDPGSYEPGRHARKYGPHFVGKFLAGFTGHALCLDYFGAPSEEEIEEGLCLHGEAGVSRWRRGQPPAVSASHVRLRLDTRVTAAGLAFERELSLLPGESVLYVQETVRNLRSADYFFHWVQHVTFGPPFLQAKESVVAMTARRGITWPLGYEGKSLLANSTEFQWPHAPGQKGDAVDLSQPFSRGGTGFVAALLTDPARPIAFIAVLNRRLGLVAGYCFRRSMFPWIAIWEENRARNGPPWNGKTQARGLEFGSTPMPIGKKETILGGSLFETPTCCRLPARGKLQVGYVSFLAAVGKGWNDIRDVEIGEKAITIVSDSGQRVEVAARKLKQVVV